MHVKIHFLCLHGIHLMVQASLKLSLCAALLIDKHSHGRVSELPGKSHLLMQMFTFSSVLIDYALFVKHLIQTHYNEQEK